MCAIVGSWTPTPTYHHLDALLADAVCRGRDSWGAVTDRNEVHGLGAYEPGQVEPLLGAFAIGNTRAEPTTEHVADKRADRDAQPFVAGPLVVSHNGTIANDHDLAPPMYDPDTRSTIDTARWAGAAALDPTVDGVLDLLSATVGSYGLAVGHRAEGWVVLATNFKPLFVRRHGEGWEWTSVNPRRLPLIDRLAVGWEPVDPYSAVVLRPGRRPEVIDLRPPVPRSSLVVASGGLDSTVAATYAAARGPTELLHVTYGCRAEAREVEAVAKVGARIGAPVHTLDLTRVFAAIGGSRLTGTWEGVAGGVAGAEFAHEWVPARNLILLSVAVGLAEAKGHSHVVLGNNLEEAGAYPDNEQEFIARLDATLPYATAANSHVTLDEPVGGLVKHEVVALGIELGAPLDVTWSCYDGGALHCGECGPCYMRRTAYAMLNRPDPIDYATEAA